MDVKEIRIIPGNGISLQSQGKNDFISITPSNGLKWEDIQLEAKDVPCKGGMIKEIKIRLSF